ncbi:hypothetical protein [Enterococcus sp.]|uniref:FliH/SctL family protein n=1 Tax=Enterococcus sp. TaxID=35783 RepID=UPI00289A3F79|nr:hypothetical protein [Enterococcus sp.]
MQWSNSPLLKQQSVKEADSARNIMTDTTPAVKYPDMTDHQTEVLRRTRELEQMRHLEQMEALKEQIINDAKAQATQIREEAQQAGYSAGQEAGYQQGYQEGLAAAQADAAALLSQAEEAVKAATAEVNLFRQEKQQDMVQYGVSIAEALIEQRFTENQEAYLGFAESVLRQFEQPDIFITVRCGTTHVEALRELLDNKKETIARFRYVLLPDAQMAPFDFHVESDHAFAVFELDKEISRFRQKVMEREGTYND